MKPKTRSIAPVEVGKLEFSLILNLLNFEDDTDGWKKFDDIKKSDKELIPDFRFTSPWSCITSQSKKLLRKGIIEIEKKQQEDKRGRKSYKKWWRLAQTPKARWTIEAILDCHIRDKVIRDKVIFGTQNTVEEMERLFDLSDKLKDIKKTSYYKLWLKAKPSKKEWLDFKKIKKKYYEETLKEYQKHRTRTKREIESLKFQQRIEDTIINSTKKELKQLEAIK
tara:strand:- start:381 stop:1049 length:669 start_codon:yes stop_codon:yes gene_type:complete